MGAAATNPSPVIGCLMAPGFWLLAGSEPGCSFSLSCELCNKTRRVTRSNWIQIISSVARWSVRRGLDSCSKSYNIFSSRCFQPSNLSVNAVIFRGAARLGAICRAAWSLLAVTRCLRVAACDPRGGLLPLSIFSAIVRPSAPCSHCLRRI